MDDKRKNLFDCERKIKGSVSVKLQTYYMPTNNVEAIEIDLTSRPA